MGVVLIYDLGVPHDHSHQPLSGAAEWDERYSGEHGEKIWSGRPNQALVTEISGMSPGTALDLGCGEGADAIWLAQQGWQVTAIDISAVALERAAEAARRAGVDVNWVRADFAEEPLPQASFDLVISFYPALLKTSGNAAMRALFNGVAPGGTLLFVWHVVDPDVPGKHGFESEAYVQADDVVTAMGDEWTIEVNENRSREVPATGQSPHADDSILRVRRQEVAAS